MREIRIGDLIRPKDPKSLYHLMTPIRGRVTTMMEPGGLFALILTREAVYYAAWCEPIPWSNESGIRVSLRKRLS